MRAHSFLRAFGVGLLAVPLTLALSTKQTAPVAHADPIVSKPVSNVGARLPWTAGTSLYLTQDANDDCCSDHVGSNKWAYDFAAMDGGAFDVVAPEAGTVVHVKMSSKHGCGDASCVNDANYVVIDHGDGTQTTMLHLAYGSLDPAIKCGAFVRRGQRLAVSGSTGWSTGIHLHVERDQVKKNLKSVCECGTDGMACTASSSQWSTFWPSASQPNVATRFAEWPNSDNPKNRRGLIGPSMNVDAKEDVVSVSANVKSKAGKSGTYEVWAFVPIGGIGETSVTVGKSTGTLESAASGGAYRPVKGLERVTLDGTEEISASVGIVLRRSGPAVVDPSLQVAKK